MNITVLSKTNNPKEKSEQLKEIGTSTVEKPLIFLNPVAHRAEKEEFMNIAQKDVALAKRVAEEKMKELSVKIKPEDLEAYKLALKNIAKNHSYAEGENLSFDDSDILVEAARRVTNGIGNAFYNIPEDERRKANVAGMIMAANDYMISLAMEELNSPVIHGYCTDQLKAIYNATALRCVAAKPRKGYIVSDAFEEQRGMSAEELQNIGGVEKTRVYLPDLSETVGAADKADMIDEKSISAPSVEL